MNEMTGKLARRATWSVWLGATGLFVVAILAFLPRVLFGFFGPSEARLALYQWIALAGLAVALIVGILAIILGASGAREANSVNRPMGILGLVLGFFCLGAVVFRTVGSALMWRFFAP